VNKVFKQQFNKAMQLSPFMLYLPDTGATMLGDFCVVKEELWKI
jgi:hypothetical protein